MSIHVCKCVHNGRVEYHLRYPGISNKKAQDLADDINGGAISLAKESSSMIDEIQTLREENERLQCELDALRAREIKIVVVE